MRKRIEIARQEEADKMRCAVHVFHASETWDNRRAELEEDRSLRDVVLEKDDETVI